MAVSDPPDQPVHDLVLRGARVVDPASGHDAVANVAITGGTITHVGPEVPSSKATVDVSGLVVAPGFIDLHSHAQSPTGLRLQSLDGVTTALDLESGTLPVDMQYRRAEEEGRPINFGFSASWVVARMHVLAGVPLPEDRTVPLSALEVFMRNQNVPGWNGLADPRQVDAILALVEEGVDQGALGIGVLLGYSPHSGRDEYFRTALLAERLGVPAFTHSRQLSNVEPGSSVDGALEIIGAAAGSGAAMHICHVNSTSLARIDEITHAIAVARSRGNRVTTEAYPYNVGSTGMGAAFLAPEHLHRMGLSPHDVLYLPTEERVRDVARLRELREEDPGGMCLLHFAARDGDDGADSLVKAIDVGAVIASDATPVIRAGRYDVHAEWPLPPGSFTHPRSLGTFARTLRMLVRERGHSLVDVIGRCSYGPAQLLADCAPAMRHKGRVQVGADADLVAFDLSTVTDRATGTVMDTSTGFRHVLVNGTFVVRDGEPQLHSLPGRGIRSERTTTTTHIGGSA
jgi:hypothetical protein